MKKSTKGALAAGAAAVLLLGGAGTIAFWTDSETISGGDVISGDLALGAAACDDGWVYADGNAGAGEAVTLIVPGDAITKECTFEVTASGDNLTATLTTPGTVEIDAPAGADSFEATVDATYADQDDAAVPGTITEANDGDVITATLTVTFPFGTDETGTPLVNANDTQNVTATLDGIDVTLTQTES